MENKYKVYLLIAALFVAGGCKKELLELDNPSAYTTNYFKDQPQFEEALTATYAVLNHPGLYARDIYYIEDLLGNDVEKATALDPEMSQFRDYSHGPSHEPLAKLWQSLYRMVSRANLFLAKAEGWAPVSAEDQSFRVRAKAEARFLRAFAYFKLVNLWGEVPLKLAYDSTGNDYRAKRASTAEIWKAIEDDLSKAIIEKDTFSLPVAYNAANRGRVTRGAAIALLGKSYLYQKKYAEAAEQFVKLTQAPFNYTLASDFNANFLDDNINSPELVFDVMHERFNNEWGTGHGYYMFSTGTESWGGKSQNFARPMEYGMLNWRNVNVAPSVPNRFKYTDLSNAAYVDPRARRTFYGNSASGGDTDYCNTCTGGPQPVPTGLWSKKFNEMYESKSDIGGPFEGTNSPVIRYADVLLMLAECYIEQNNIGSALPLINQVRARVGAYEYTSLGDQAAARTILRRERELELWGEQVRFADLVRWGIAKEVLNAEKRAVLGFDPFQDKHVLLPIPALESASNPNVANSVKNGWN